MKKTILLFSSLMLLFVVQESVAQRGPAGSPKATVSQMIGNTEMTIVYSRPSLAGRDVNKLVTDPRENGDVWRTGANQNTVISFDKDVTIGGQALKAGSYSLFTIPGEGEWTIIINSATDKWGTQYNKSTDVLRFSAKASTTSGSVETFTINMTDFDNKAKDKANIELAWGNISVKFPVKVTN